MNTIWQEFLTLVREEVGSRVVETWFKAISFNEWDELNKTVYLQAPNNFVRNWVKKNYISLLQLHLGRLLHAQNPEIIFLDSQEQNKDAEKKEPPKKETVVFPATVVRQQNRSVSTETQNGFNQLQKRYTFDTFVVGPSNSLSFAAAHAVAEKPGKLYNPLFIYGDSGLGKTHLLHAIGNEIRDQNNKYFVAYQSADRFVSEFIHAIRFDKVHNFKQKYQRVDVLLIDDLQFISGKEQTQEAFFHIFNSLYESHKQIVFSSDTFPDDLQGIADRLRSRIAAGLVTDIHRPSFETKIAILKKKASHSKEHIPDEVLDFIARHVQSNIRELEGALVRVAAYASLSHEPVTLSLARNVLKRHEKQPTNRKVTCQQVLQAVSKHVPYSPQELCSASRNKHIMFGRHIAIFLMKKLTGRSLREIGSFLGGRDHTTIKHALESVDKKILIDEHLQEQIERIEDEILC